MKVIEGTSLGKSIRVVVLVSADGEWRSVREIYPDQAFQQTPYGEWFVHQVRLGGDSLPTVLFQGGWGKIAAAGSTQYAIDRWDPELLVNLGTCGGLEGHVARGEIILVERTLVYDIYEQMGDLTDHLDHYTTLLDLSWLSRELPLEVRRAQLVSGDRDLLPEDLPYLRERFGAIAGDWESAAIAWVAARNRVRCLILRGITDLVGAEGGEIYGDIGLYHMAAARMMRRLVDSLPGWLVAAGF